MLGVLELVHVALLIGIEDLLDKVSLIEHSVHDVFTLGSLIQQVNKNVCNFLVQDVVERVLAEVIQQAVVNVAGQQYVMEVVAVKHSEGVIKKFYSPHPHCAERSVT